MDFMTNKKSKLLLKAWLITMWAIQFVQWKMVGGSTFSLITAELCLLCVWLIVINSPFNFIVGVISSSMMVYTAAKIGVKGDALYQCLLIAMDIFGIYGWIKMSKAREEKTSLSDKEWRNILLIFVVLQLVMTVVLKNFGSVRPEIDSLTFVFGLLCMYLTVRNYSYVFNFWLVSNIIQSALWYSVIDISVDSMTYSLMYIVFLMNSVVGLVVSIMRRKSKKGVVDHGVRNSNQVK